MFAQASVAVLALLAGNAAAATYSNSTLAAPTVGTKLAVDGKLWQYDGCLGSRSQFSSFALVSNSAAQTVETCLASCNTRFAGIYESACYCANVLDEASSVGSGVCNLACPGAPTEVCGGNALVAKRQVSDTVLLSLYEQVASAAVVNGTTAIPAAGELVEVTIINNYFDVCGCAEGIALTSATSTITYAHCGCATSTIPSLPMTTAVETVVVNGATATVTLTLPCTATATGSAVYYNGTCVGAGCPYVPSGVSTCTVATQSPATATATATVSVCTGAGCPAAATGAVTVKTVTVSQCPAAATAPAGVASAAAAASSAAAASAAAAAASSAAAAACGGAATCPGVATVVVGAAKATGTASGATTTVACATCPGGAKYTGAASANQVGGIIMAAGLAAALL